MDTCLKQLQLLMLESLTSSSNIYYEYNLFATIRANVRVYKITSNGGDFFGNPVALTLGSNSITVAGVGFDRAVKQFSDAGASMVMFRLLVNGEDSNYDVQVFDANGAQQNSNNRLYRRIRLW